MVMNREQIMTQILTDAGAQPGAMGLLFEKIKRENPAVRARLEAEVPEAEAAETLERLRSELPGIFNWMLAGIKG
jgi:hypothetical protein